MRQPWQDIHLTSLEIVGIVLMVASLNVPFVLGFTAFFLRRLSQPLPSISDEDVRDMEQQQLERARRLGRLYRRILPFSIAVFVLSIVLLHMGSR